MDETGGQRNTASARVLERIGMRRRAGNVRLLVTTERRLPLDVPFERPVKGRISHHRAKQEFGLCGKVDPGGYIFSATDALAAAPGWSAGGWLNDTSAPLTFLLQLPQAMFSPLAVDVKTAK